MRAQSHAARCAARRQFVVAAGAECRTRQFLVRRLERFVRRGTVKLVVSPGGAQFLLVEPAARLQRPVVEFLVERSRTEFELLLERPRTEFQLFLERSCAELEFIVQRPGSELEFLLERAAEFQFLLVAAEQQLVERSIEQLLIQREFFARRILIVQRQFRAGRKFLVQQFLAAGQLVVFRSIGVVVERTGRELVLERAAASEQQLVCAGHVQQFIRQLVVERRPGQLLIIVERTARRLFVVGRRIVHQFLDESSSRQQHVLDEQRLERIAVGEQFKRDYARGVGPSAARP